MPTTAQLNGRRMPGKLIVLGARRSPGVRYTSRGRCRSPKTRKAATAIATAKNTALTASAYMIAELNLAGIQLVSSGVTTNVATTTANITAK